MKRYLLLFLLLISSTAYAGHRRPFDYVITSNTVTQDGKIKFYIRDADGLIVRAERTENIGIDYPQVREWLNGEVAGAEIVYSDPDDVSNVTADSRTGAKAITDLSASEGVKWRTTILILIDEINILRQRDAERAAAVAAATSLSNLQARWANITPTFGDRTLQQFKNAYTNKIDAGSAD